jgi:hypothetical protein
MGAALGSAVLPNMLGSLMYTYGPAILMTCYSLLGCAMVVLYLVVHLYLLRHSKLRAQAMIVSEKSHSDVNSYQHAVNVLQRATARQSAANLVNLDAATAVDKNEGGGGTCVDDDPVFV